MSAPPENVGASSGDNATILWLVGVSNHGSHFLELFDSTHLSFALAFAHYLFFFSPSFGSLFILFRLRLGITFGVGTRVPCSFPPPYPPSPPNLTVHRPAWPIECQPLSKGLRGMQGRW